MYKQIICCGDEIKEDIVLIAMRKTTRKNSHTFALVRLFYWNGLISREITFFVKIPLKPTLHLLKTEKFCFRRAAII